MDATSERVRRVGHGLASVVPSGCTFRRTRGRVKYAAYRSTLAAVDRLRHADDETRAVTCSSNVSRRKAQCRQRKGRADRRHPRKVENISRDSPTAAGTCTSRPFLDVRENFETMRGDMCTCCAPEEVRVEKYDTLYLNSLVNKPSTRTGKEYCLIDCQTVGLWILCKKRTKRANCFCLCP